MTWSRFDDAAPKHPKARLAGNDAWMLWSAAVMYCNRYLTDGFVPLAALATECLPEPITMAKAKKLAEKLVDARVQPDGCGLFERVDGGYRVHDFLNWNPSKEEVESKRKKDRERKKPWPESSGSPPGNPSGIPGGIPDGNPSGSRADSLAPARGPAPAGARVPAQPAVPVPAQPIPPARGLRCAPGRLVGSRPMIVEVLPTKTTARELEIPPEFAAYCRELRGTDRDFESAVADFREKITTPGTGAWLGSKLCRFIETACVHVGEVPPAQPATRVPAPTNQPPQGTGLGAVPEGFSLAPRKAASGPRRTREEALAELDRVAAEEASGEQQEAAGNA